MDTCESRPSIQSQTSFAKIADKLRMDDDQNVSIKEMEGQEISGDNGSGSYTGVSKLVLNEVYDKDQLTKSTNSNNSN